jgi:predicted metalloprotease with PDZ domain
MLKLLVCLTLLGSASTQYGRIGVVISQHGRIAKVYAVSPARSAGLQVGDTIISADGKAGNERIDGDAGSIAHLVVRKRSGEIQLIDCVRAPKHEVKD